MPIKPENKARYPSDWPEISHRIRFERAQGRCECDGRCGHDHGGRCEAKHGLPHPVTGSKVVLTTMHLNHTPEDCSDENLLAGCQRCHLAYDRPYHIEQRRISKAAADDAKRNCRVMNAERMAFEHECKGGKRLPRINNANRT